MFISFNPQLLAVCVIYLFFLINSFILLRNNFFFAFYKFMPHADFRLQINEHKQHLVFLFKNFIRQFLIIWINNPLFYCGFSNWNIRVGVIWSSMFKVICQSLLLNITLHQCFSKFLWCNFNNLVTEILTFLLWLFTKKNHMTRNTFSNMGFTRICKNV